MIQAEVAQTMKQQSIGLMYRRTMAVNEGMLFIYDSPQVRCFWMRNTLLPLTIAFIADDGSIVNLKDMQPETESSHCCHQTGTLRTGDESGLVRKTRFEARL